MKKFIISLILGVVGIIGVTNGYYFGLKSSDDTTWNIQQIESQLGVGLPIVSFIFDPWEHHNVPAKMDQIAEELGSDRIYHITISPNMYSAKEVAEGAFDSQYLQFFEKVKEHNLRVIFRTMHEMNGGRYPRSSNPEQFKNAWIHVWNLSRTAGLDQSQILFDFSVNHRDMPTKSTPSQTATLYQCKPGTVGSGGSVGHPQWKDCPRFEDYYPGEQYVDIVGFTFYNRGKASSNRLWLTPEEILYDEEWKTLERVKALGRPIIIDEVGTTAVWYSETYDFNKSRQEYLSTTARKELRLGQLQSFFTQHPEILATIYFNVDYTHGLSFNVIGEADWAIVNLTENKIYQGFYNLYQKSEHDLGNILKYFMNAKLITLGEQKVIISSDIEKEVGFIDELLDKKAETKEEKAELVDKLVNIGIKDWKIEESLKVLKQAYPLGEKPIH